jgi:hypothetical protein
VHLYLRQDHAQIRTEITELADIFNIKYRALLILKIWSYSSQSSNGIATVITYLARLYCREAAIYYNKVVDTTTETTA